MSAGNPMGINGPNSAGNYIQPGTQNPTPPASQPAIAGFPVGRNVMGIVYPIPPPAPNVTDNPPVPQPLGIFPHLTS
jgi:hypothetical protein